MPPNIPPDRLERNPCITEEGFRMLGRISQHAHAPVWNYEVGDRVRPADLERAEAYRSEIADNRKAGQASPPPSILDWVRAMRSKVELFRENLPEGFDVESDWRAIPCMDRDDVVVRPEAIVPDDADLSGLIVYDTSGTTGHAMVVPWRPGAIALNHPMMEYMLRRYGISIDFGPEMVGCINVSARAICVVFPNVFSVWNNSGFAKVNLHKNGWRSRDDARKFFKEMNPAFITGDPVAFAEMAAWGIDVKPAALVSTAVTMSPMLKARLEALYCCPVIDWYSITEAGPIAYSCTHGFGMHVLPPDIFVETVDEDGDPAAPGEMGEITITGGRNPYLPLLRYRTGDHGVMNYDPCPCGDPMPRIMDMQGRALVLFRSSNGDIVNQVDIGRIMREIVFVQHEFVQRADGSCEVAIRPAPGATVDPDKVVELLQRVMGPDTPIKVMIDENLGRDSKSGKVIPYRSEILVEDRLPG